MNHRQRHVPPGVNRLMHFFSLLLFAVSAPGGLLAMTRQPQSRPDLAGANRREYLSAVGAPALRFQKQFLPATRLPGLLPAAASIPGVASKENPAAAASIPASPPLPPPVAHDPVDSALKPETSSAAKTKTSPGILHDDTRPSIHPEDFLPFFQFPSPGTQSGGMNVLVPVSNDATASAPLPVSSANYTQTPK